MSTPYEAQEWKNDINAFKAEYGLEGGCVGTPYEIKPWMNEIEALRAEIDEGGGGGSSDISTAELTINTTGSGQCDIRVANVLEDSDPEYTASFGGYATVNEESFVLTIILYKGKAELDVVDGHVDSVSGAISHVDLNMYMITGNCTINVTTG